MNNKTCRRFLLKSLTILVIATLAGIFIFPYINHPVRWFFPLAPTATFGINVLAFFLAATQTVRKNFNLQLLFLFGIKFFAYLALSILFFVFEPKTQIRLLYIAFVFGLYLSNTIVLLLDIMKFNKTSANS